MNHSTETKRRHFGRFTPFDDEKVIRVQHMHWKNRIGSIIVIILCTAMLMQKMQYPHFSYIGFLWNKPIGKPTHEALYYATSLFLIYLILKATISFFRSFFVRYYVTNQRVVAITGIVSIHTSEILLNKCENIQLSQNAGERLFNSGDIQLFGAGTAVILNDVYKARELKHLISELVHSLDKNKRNEECHKDDEYNPMYDIKI